MKILCWLLFVGLNGYLLFVFAKKFERAYLIKLFLAGVPVVMVSFVVFALTIRLLGLHPNYVFKFYALSILMSLVALCMINFINPVFHYMVQHVLEFHQQHNAANLHRQPIKFFTDNQHTIMGVATVIWFLGSALMLYGVWLGER
jgi:hypothetical protein